MLDEIKQIKGSSQESFPKIKSLQIAELDDSSLAIIFEKDLKLYVGRRGKDAYFPLLKDELILPSLPRARVDIGAVKYVCNGANIMRPGIVSFTGGFEKSALILVEEASHSKAIAIGRTLMTADDMKNLHKGIAIENYHYVGDKFWEALKIL